MPDAVASRAREGTPGPSLLIKGIKAANEEVSQATSWGSGLGVGVGVRSSAFIR